MTVVRKRVKEVAPKFDLTPERLEGWLQLTRLGSGSNQTRCVFALITPPSSSINASELINALLDNTAPAIEAEYQAMFETRFSDYEERRAMAKSQEAAAKTKAEELEKQISGITGMPRNDPESIKGTCQTIAEQLQGMELEFLGKSERKKAIVQQVADRSAAIEQEADKDLIVAELRKVVDAREASVEITKQQHATGVSSAKEVSEAIAALAESRARLLDRRRQAALDAGAAALQDLNREMMTLSIDLQEIQARQEFLNGRIERLRRAASLAEAQRRCWSDMSMAAAILSGRPPKMPGRVTVIVNGE